jgi:hypothetical protein
VSRPCLGEAAVTPAAEAAVTGASGWDDMIFRLGDELAFRPPGRAAAAALLGHEQAVLPRLAPRLPLAVWRTTT